MTTLLARARSSWRAMGLILAFALLAGPALSGGGTAGVAAAATTARWASCPGVSFYPLFSDGYDQASFYGTNEAHGRFGHGVLTCPLQLPPGATITAVKFHLYDSYPSQNIGPCNLSRVKLDPPSGTIQSLAGPRSTSGAPGYVTLTDTSIERATVNNHYYAYYASCTLSFMSSDLGILGVSVRYVP